MSSSSPDSIHPQHLIIINSKANCRICPIRDFMSVLIISKFDEVSVKIEVALPETNMGFFSIQKEKCMI